MRLIISATYTNDILGLAQVLVADDGTEQVYNLFGLDLILQDSGSEVRTLLADGLGSVRLEILDGIVETATTYSPYGEVLAQVGTSGTVYGFTGEQEDNATGLLYLRARYYDSSLKTFMSRDPWEGTGWRPQTLNHYTYVLGNPTRFSDPIGLCEMDPYDPYVDYDCWLLARRLSEWEGGGYEEFITWDRDNLLLHACASGFWTELWNSYDRFDITLAYIYQEMISNAQSQIVRDIRTWLGISCDAALAVAGFPSPSSPSPISLRIAALGAWAAKTCSGCEWDHKGILDGMLGLGNTPPTGDYWFPVRGDTEHEYFYDIWSNIHFGFVGSAAGFDEMTLQRGAAFGDFIAGTNDAADELSVSIGVELWRNYGLSLVRSQLHRAILRSRDEYLSIQRVNTGVNVIIEWTNGI